jgi:ABC-2 type transport system ATP-binding protein
LNLAAIEVASLSKAYGNVVALAEVDLDVQAGEIFGLVGPNGAGKTTLIRTLVGALQADSGNVKVLGLNPHADRWALRRRVGYMPQRPALYDDLSARRNIAFFTHRIEGTGVDEALALVELTDRADDPLHTLSGGMQQRVSLAAALAHRPELLLLDEPTAGVDPELRATFWERIRELADDGRTVVVSTHQMAEAMACDRVAILRSGRVLVCDDPRRLLGGGRATVRIWRNGRLEDHQLENYASALAPLIRTGDVERIEVEQETLEDVVLRLIKGSDGR